KPGQCYGSIYAIAEAVGSETDNVLGPVEFRNLSYRDTNLVWHAAPAALPYCCYGPSSATLPTSTPYPYGLWSIPGENNHWLAGSALPTPTGNGYYKNEFGVLGLGTSTLWPWYWVNVSSSIGHTSGSGWYLYGATVQPQASAVIPIATNQRYTLSGWNAVGLMLGFANFTVTRNMTITPIYTQEYFVTVNSPYGTTSGSGWSPLGVQEYTVTPTSVTWNGTLGLLGVKSTLAGWTVTPTMVTAVWTTDYGVMLPSLLELAAILVSAGLLLLCRTRITTKNAMTYFLALYFIIPGYFSYWQFSNIGQVPVAQLSWFASALAFLRGWTLTLQNSNYLWLATALPIFLLGLMVYQYETRSHKVAAWCFVLALILTAISVFNLYVLWFTDTWYYELAIPIQTAFIIPFTLLAYKNLTTVESPQAQLSHLSRFSHRVWHELKNVRTWMWVLLVLYLILPDYYYRANWAPQTGGATGWLWFALNCMSYCPLMWAFNYPSLAYYYIRDFIIDQITRFRYTILYYWSSAQSYYVLSSLIEPIMPLLLVTLMFFESRRHTRNRALAILVSAFVLMAPLLYDCYLTLSASYYTSFIPTHAVIIVPFTILAFVNWSRSKTSNIEFRESEDSSKRGQSLGSSFRRGAKILVACILIALIVAGASLEYPHPQQSVTVTTTAFIPETVTVTKISPRLTGGLQFNGSIGYSGVGKSQYVIVLHHPANVVMVFVILSQKSLPSSMTSNGAALTALASIATSSSLSSPFLLGGFISTNRTDNFIFNFPAGDAILVAFMWFTGRGATATVENYATSAWTSVNPFSVTQGAGSISGRMTPYFAATWKDVPSSNPSINLDPQITPVNTYVQSQPGWRQMQLDCGYISNNSSSITTGYSFFNAGVGSVAFLGFDLS